MNFILYFDVMFSMIVKKSLIRNKYAIKVILLF